MDSLSVFSWNPHVQTRCVGRTCAYLTCLACQFVLWESWYSVVDCDLYCAFRILPTSSPLPALSQVAFVVCFASLDTLPEGWTLVLVGYGFSHLLCSLKGRTCEVRFSVVAVWFHLFSQPVFLFSPLNHHLLKYVACQQLRGNNTTLEITRLASPTGITIKVYKVLQNKILGHQEESPPLNIWDQQVAFFRHGLLNVASVFIISSSSGDCQECWSSRPGLLVNNSEP